jgi:hypothetical protein
MHTLFALILKPRNIIFVFISFFSMKANQKVFPYDDFVGAKHGFHHLKHD